MGRVMQWWIVFWCAHEDEILRVEGRRLFLECLSCRKQTCLDAPTGPTLWTMRGTRPMVLVDAGVRLGAECPQGPPAQQVTGCSQDATARAVAGPSSAHGWSDRAAARFHQIATIERRLSKLRKRIGDKKTELATLKKEEEAAIETMFEAARNEGDPPLF